MLLIAVNGKEALQLLRAGAEPALILLDLRLSVRERFQFKRECVRDPRLSRIPTIVYSCNAQLKPRIAEGATASREKPVEFDTLLHLVATHCRSKAVKSSSSGQHR